MVERHNIPGGCATSFKRGRFEFEASLHELATYGGEGAEGRVGQYFEELGVDADLYPINDCFTAIMAYPDKPPYKVVMPNGREEFIATLGKFSPGSEESVRAMFELGDECIEAWGYMQEHINDLDHKDLEEKFPNFIRVAYRSVNEVFNALEIPEEAQRIIKTYWSYIGIPTNEFDFTFYSFLLLSYIDHHAWLPKSRSHGMSTAIEQAFRNWGGEMWYNTTVDEILMEDGKACGIRVGDKEIRAKQIIGNINPHVVYSKMMKPENVPERAVKLANSRTQGVSGVTVYYGLNASPEEIGITDYSVFCNVAPPEMMFQKFGMFDPDQMAGVLNCPNLVIPNYTEEGTCILWATTLLRPGTFDNVTPEEYFKVKERMAYSFAGFYKMITGIDILPYIEEVEVATPVTFARYLSTPGGSIYGYQGQMWDNAVPRLLNYKEENYTENLTFCGGHSFSMDGYSSAMDTGKVASAVVLEKFKERPGIVREGGR